MSEGYVDYGDLREEMRKELRNEIIEECARELEAFFRRRMMWGEDNGWFVDAVAAIRGLKDRL